MDINFDSALHTYIVEARDLLQEMEEALLVLENDPDDIEIVDSIFRGAHTIKGSAGLFGLLPVVSFTHGVEDVLDRMRDTTLRIDSPLIALLLACTDHIGELVNVVAEQGASLDVLALQREAVLREQLAQYQLGQVSHPDLLRPDMALRDEPLQAEILDWHISLRFSEQVFRNGMDPFSFLRYLNTLGEIQRIVTTVAAMPTLSEMDPESCYLGFEIRFRSSQTFETINEVFDFVRDDCVVRILPPHAPMADFQALISQLPEGREQAELFLLESGSLVLGESGEPARESLARQAVATPESLPDGLVESGSDLVPQAPAREQKVRDSRYVRVHADKLEELINLVGELVIAGAGAKLLARDCAEPKLRDATAAVADLVERTLDGALRMRMVPIGDTFSRFQRVVRDVSLALGKEIELEISGGETELDKTVVERIADPLMHLIRNALDHGIESPDVRLASGKPAKGRLHLNAFHDAGNIILEIIDDGRGLDRDRILQKGRERHLLAATATATPGDSEIYNLIFEPGFSTAEAVTNLSGRGVGMDVVKRNITALRGTIDLDSRRGLGTTVRICLPLTLAIINGFLVGVGDAHYVVPLERVQECMELTPLANEEARRCGYIDLRGEVLPLLFMHDYFSIGGAGSRRQNVVVVHHLNKKIGLVVDELMGEYQTVIKPLGKLFGALHGFGGSSILGSGAIALILDIPALLTRLSEDG